jgi:hypothetical protein
MNCGGWIYGGSRAMWIYVQRTGGMYRNRASDDRLVEVGYSGNGPSKNNPDDQFLPDRGPLPCGVYTIGAPTDAGPTAFSLPLTPVRMNKTRGRFGFYIHGDSILKPGDASKGCIILTFAARRTIADSGDSHLKVRADLPWRLWRPARAWAARKDRGQLGLDAQRGSGSAPVESAKDDAQI